LIVGAIIESKKMKEIVASITQRGQVTIPAEVRRLLGVKPRDKVAFEVDDGHVRLVPVKFTLESAYQSVPPLAKKLTDKQMIRIVKEERAQRFVRKLQKP